MFRRSGITGTNKRSDGKRSDGKRSGERFSSVGIALIAFSLCAWIVYLFLLPSTNPDIYWQTLITAAVILIGGLLLRRARRIIEKKNEAFLIITLLLFCIAVKLTWVLCFRIQPLTDYRTFFLSAKELALHGSISDGRYIALFPHIFGYSGFLSLFYTLFGAGELVAPLVNTALTCISLLLIYSICRRLFSVSAAVYACLFWILCPSQTIYNMFALSEPLYTTMLLGFWALLLYVEEQKLLTRPKPFVSITGIAVLFAVLLAAINAVRPIAMILILSLLIGLFLLKDNRGQGAHSMRNRLYLVVFVAVFYALLSVCTNHFIASRIGEEPSTLPGYSLYVGINKDSAGKYSTGDANLLYTYSDLPHWSAQDVQEAMFGDFKKRLTGDSIDFPALLARKFQILWADDSAAVVYMRTIIADPQERGRYAVACNSFYLFMVFLSVAALLIMIRRREKPFAFLFPLYLIGLTAAQLLVEVAGRYHYSGIVVFIILSAYVLSLPPARKEIRK